MLGSLKLSFSQMKIVRNHSTNRMLLVTIMKLMMICPLKSPMH